MTQTPLRQLHQSEPATISSLIGGALRKSLIVALVVSVGLAVFKAGTTAASGGELAPLPLTYYAARAALLTLLLMFPVFLLWSTRSMKDRAFTWLGFAATFFGLAMLVVFFAQLCVEVSEWFYHVPKMIAVQNAELEELDRELQNLEKLKAAKLASLEKELEREVAAAPANEKEEMRRFFKEEVIPGQLKDYDITLGELQQKATGSVRPDSSPLAILSYFLTNGPSSIPQDAGIYPAFLGSLWLGLITIVFAVPIGVGAAVYLDEIKSTRPILAHFQHLVQLNINNLAGVPSVVFGILGAFVFVELIFKPMESEAIAARNVFGGGLTLALLTLPVVIVSAQEAIRAVPISIRQGAYALGATRWQVIYYNVLPMARPGILTGTILSLSRAIGEAAPLVMFGALLFVNQNPTPFSRFTIMPMQIFGWSDRPAIPVPYQEESVEIWKYNAALASVLLLVMLLSLNGLAIYLRNRAQRSTRY
jgi:phosphate transport system permease protein